MFPDLQFGGVPMDSCCMSTSSVEMHAAFGIRDIKLIHSHCFERYSSSDENFVGSRSVNTVHVTVSALS